jgi:hypothetical protein
MWDQEEGEGQESMRRGDRGMWKPEKRMGRGQEDGMGF